MARVLNVPIEVDGSELRPGAAPRAFTFRGRRYRVIRILECWRQTGRWWVGEGERIVQRVEVVGGGVFELAYEETLQQWVLYRIYD